MKKNSEDQLKKVQQQLEVLESEYQEFAHIVAHDLRAPLRAMEGFASIISDRNADIFDEKTKQHFDLIFKSVEHSQAMLDALLAFSRCHSPAEPFAEIDGKAIVEEVKEKLLDLISSSNAEIIISSEFPSILGDKQQITQLFYLLLENSLIYQAEGRQLSITISLVEKDHHWQFSIRDNGIGIKSNLTEKIFKPLRRAVKNSDYPGMGMGLAIAKKIVGNHDGSIHVESEQGIGSSFHFTIAKKPGYGQNSKFSP